MEDKMVNKEKYIKDLESTLEKYANKYSELDSKLKNYKAHDKKQLEVERKDLTKKLEEIKDSAGEIFEALGDAFQDFSNLLTMDQIYHVKDEVAAYGCERVEDVEGYIKKKPLVCVAVALGVGVLLGTILMRSK
jgi:ElaB/YqjD/DUF883 family membrane-anchored ribosome-binding protein